MKRVPVIPVLIDNHGPDDVERIKYWCEHIMIPLTTTLLPKWHKDTLDIVDNEGVASAAVTDHLCDLFSSIWHGEFKILSLDGKEVSCTQEFGLYYPDSTILIVVLEPADGVHEMTLERLFAVNRLPNEELYRYYLVLRLEEIRIGSIVRAPVTDIGLVNMGDEQVQAIVAAAEL